MNVIVPLISRIIYWYVAKIFMQITFSILKYQVLLSLRTALERPVSKYFGALTCFTGPTSPLVLAVVQYIDLSV